MIRAKKQSRKIIGKTSPAEKSYRGRLLSKRTTSIQLPLKSLNREGADGIISTPRVRIKGEGRGEPPKTSKNVARGGVMSTSTKSAYGVHWGK